MKHKGNIDLEGNDMVDVGKIVPTAVSVVAFDDESVDLIYLYEDTSDSTRQMTASNMAIQFHNSTSGLRAAEEIHIGNTDLTLNNDRGLNMDGNAFTIDTNSGDFYIEDTGITRFEVNPFTVEIEGLKYPTSDGTNGQVLTTNGTGTLSFTTVSGGGGGTPLASADQTLTGDRLIDTNGYNLEIELDPTGTADTFTIHDGTHDLFEVNTNTSGTLFSVNDVSGLPTFQSNDDGSAVMPKVLTAAPTGTPPEGTMQLAIVSGTSYLYVYINGAWRKTTLA